MNPIGIQRKRTKGWRLPENTVCVSRPSIYGNPFKIGYHEHGCHTCWRDAQDVCNLYEQELDVIISNLNITREEFFAPLRGKNLACWCPLDSPCHRDILLRLANPELSEVIAAGIDK